MKTDEIRIFEVKTKSDLKRFVTFPFLLNKNNPFWVPPLIQEEINYFNPDKNPVYDHANTKLFLAFKKEKIVGRIAAIMNFYEIQQMGIKKMRFGWFDFIDDMEVSKMLLDKIHELGKENNLDFVEGPVGFSNLDKVGVLTKGFEELGDMITWYNAPYYEEHFIKMGYETANEWHEHYFEISLKPERTEQFSHISEIIKKRYRLNVVSFKTSKEVLPYIDKIFELFDKSYRKLESFVPISEKQIQFFKDKYINIIDPEFIKYIEDEHQNPIGFALTIRNFSNALKKANGKLFPFGFYHLLKARKQSKEVVFYLIGIHPDYQKKGVLAIIFDEFAKSYTKHGIKKAYRTPELTTNKDIHDIWKEFNPIHHKSRKTYRKIISQ